VIAPTEGYLEIGGRRTWYRTTGERTGAPPVLALHGGPGACTPDDGLLATVLAEDRQVIAYDQLDSGRSERVSDPSRWTMDALVDELHAVRRALDLDELHLLGQSWGGTLAVLYALRGKEAAGIRSLTLASGPIDLPRWVERANAARAALPAPTQRAMARCERSLLRRPAPPPKPGPGPSSAQLRAQAARTLKAMPLMRRGAVQAMARAASHVPFLRRGIYPVLGLELASRHVYRDLAMPVGAMVGLAGMNAAVYEAIWGPSEFAGVGPLAALDLRDRLGEIDVPVLVTSGAHELFAPEDAHALAQGVPDGRWALFEQSAHCAEYEEPDRYASVVRDFLRAVDRHDATATASASSA
jgi:proline iminopeptidase